jgi:hypothetical protein
MRRWLMLFYDVVKIRKSATLCLSITWPIIRVFEWKELSERTLLPVLLLSVL